MNASNPQRGGLLDYLEAGPRYHGKLSLAERVAAQRNEELMAQDWEELGSSPGYPGPIYGFCACGAGIATPGAYECSICARRSNRPSPNQLTLALSGA